MKTRDVDEARHAFSALYGEATFEPARRASFDFTLQVVMCGALNFVAGDWPSGVRLFIPSVGDRYGVTLAAGGASSGEHAGASFVIEPGSQGALFSAGQRVTGDVAPGFQGRTVTIERRALEQHLTVLTGRTKSGPLGFEVGLDLMRGPGAVVHEIVSLLRRQAEQPLASPLLIASLRDAFLTSLLTNINHSASMLFNAPPARVAPGCVRRAEEYMVARAAEPVSLADIVAAAGVPARTLRAAFTAHRGLPLMAFLRKRRFELARDRLRAAEPDTTVVRVVTTLGLGGAGRFSVEYKKRFGESPSETLAAGRARRG